MATTKLTTIPPVALRKTNDGPSPAVSSVVATPIERDDQGRFPKGVSGNPAGRPVGSRNKATVLREQLDERAVEEIANEYVEVLWAMIRRAKGGDVQAAKFLQNIVQLVTDQGGAKGKGGGGRTIQVYIENYTQEVKDERQDEQTVQREREPERPGELGPPDA